MVSLYIENKLIELDNEVQFAITKTFEDISNPTSIINDWSKTVSIPFTDSNNEIFGHIYNPDRLTLYTSDESLTTGLYFDPLKKLDFRLEWDSMLLMQGYAKMTSITKSNGKGRYNVTLNGELGKVFQEMKKITFDETAYTGEDKDKYWINGADIEEKTISASTIKELWTTTPVYESKFSEMTNFVNFAPNIAFNDGFNYKGFSKFGEYTTFVDVLKENEFEEVTGVGIETLIPNGLNPREFGEFRSYLQLPFINIYKLFAIFKNKFESFSDYKIEYDELWMNEKNPYWANLVYTLKPLDLNSANSILKTHISSFPQSSRWNNSYGNTTPQTLVATISGNDEYISNNRVNIKDNNIVLSTDYRITLAGSKNVGTTKLNQNNAFIIEPIITYYNISGTAVRTQATKPFAIVDNDSTLIDDATRFSIIRVGSGNKNLFNGYAAWEFTLPINVSLLPQSNEYYAKLSFKCNWRNANKTINTIASNPVSFVYGNNTNIYLKVNNNVKRSFSKFTINDVWDNKINLFDALLNYCKQFRLLIRIDENAKVVIFTGSKYFFKDYTIEDWTDKLDISKEYSIKPITFENKYVLFNYEDNDTELNKLYKEKYGVNFGEYKLTTEYNFNIETKNLFEKIETGIASSGNLLSSKDLMQNTIMYYITSDSFIANYKEENKQANIFGQYFFFKGLKEFDRSVNLPLVQVSDDTPKQIFTEDFYYSNNGENVNTYPYLTSFYDTYCSLYTKPMQVFTTEEIDDELKGIFENFWKDYLDERYNINNKVVTCYLDIKPLDYCNFKFNKFIKIDNQLYFVNKIYDYDITSNSPTKVDLITVQNLDGYIEDKFTYKLLTLTDENGNPVNNITLNYINTSKTYYLSSYSDVNWTSSGGLAIVNNVSGSGTIRAGVNVPVTFTLANGNSTNYTITFTNEVGDILTISMSDESGFRLYKTNGVEWNSATDRVVFIVENGEIDSEVYNLYAYSTEPILVTDVYDNLLHGVSLNQLYSGDYLQAGLPRKIDIWNDREYRSVQGTVRLTALGNSYDIDIEVIAIG